MWQLATPFKTVSRTLLVIHLDSGLGSIGSVGIVVTVTKEMLGPAASRLLKCPILNGHLARTLETIKLIFPSYQLIRLYTAIVPYLLLSAWP